MRPADMRPDAGKLIEKNGDLAVPPIIILVITYGFGGSVPPRAKGDRLEGSPRYCAHIPIQSVDSKCRSNSCALA